MFSKNIFVLFLCFLSYLILLCFSSSKRARVEGDKTSSDQRPLPMSSLARPPPSSTPSLPRPAGSPSPKGMDIRKRLTMEYLIDQNRALSRHLDRNDVISISLASIANSLASQSQSQFIKSQELLLAQNRDLQSTLDSLRETHNKTCLDVDYLVSCVHPDIRDKVLSLLPSKKGVS